MWKSFKDSFESPDSYVSLALGLAVVLVVGMITFNYFKAKTSQLTEKAEQKTVESTEMAKTLPTKYTVLSGDTLWSISEKIYKSGYNWVDIQKANNLTDAGFIEKDQVLVIPDVKPIAMSTGQVSSASTEIKTEKRQYTVARGDSLWTIAVKVYNDGYKWVAIAEANNITQPDVIFAGNVLVMP